MGFKFPHWQALRMPQTCILQYTVICGIPKKETVICELEYPFPNGC